MPRTKSRSPSTSPAKNTPEHYESAAREIEQEKQMVAALKRLSIGHLMNLDPDIPASDASFSFLLDRELSSEPETYPEAPLSAHLSSESEESEISVSHEDITRSNSAANARNPLSESESPENTQPSSVGEEPRSDELLWVPANVHPEVNPQQYKNHVKSAIDELLERKLSRSKSANRSKRSSLSFSTTDDVGTEMETPAYNGKREIAAEAQNFAGSHDHRSQNRLSNPSLRRLTSELQTMSRLAGMDSSDAVTLARSLSTSSLGYSDVERTAIDDLEHANHSGSASHAELVDVGYDEHAPVPFKTPTHSPRSNSPSDYGRRHTHRADPSFRPGPNGSLRSPSGYASDDFSLRRSRRVDYRKSPTTSSSGSQLQNNKAGKLAQLRHNLSSSNLQSDLRPGLQAGQNPNFIDTNAKRENSTSNHSAPRSSIQSINPRSSQVLFSYKVPAHSGHTRSLSSKSAPGVPLAALSANDSPYSTAKTSDALGRNLSATKYSQHNLTSKTLSHPSPAAQPLYKISDPSTSPRLGSRKSSREHEKKAKYGPLSGQKAHDHYQMRDLNSSWNSRSSHSHRQVSPTSPSMQSFPMRVSSSNEGQWSEQHKRYVSPNSLPANSSQQIPRLISGEKLVSMKSRPYNKRDKTRELNQNLDLLRNEINEFKESLATKVDPNKTKEDAVQASSSEPLKDSNAGSEPADFSFDLTHQDVSYEDTLGIEADVLTELGTPEKQRQETSVSDDGRDLSTFDEPKTDEIVSIPESSDVESTHFRETVAQDTRMTQKLLAGQSTESLQVEKSRDQSKETFVNELGPSNTSLLEAGENHELKGDSVQVRTPKHSRAEKVGMYGLIQDGEHKSSSEEVHTKEVTSRKVSKDSQTSTKSTEKDSAKLSSGASAEVEKKRSKKPWPWSKEKSSSKKGIDQKSSLTEIRSPVRSVSSPEMAGLKRESPATKDESPSKENAITKFFRKKRSSSVSHEKSTSEIASAKVSHESLEIEREHSSNVHFKEKRNSRASAKSGFEDASSQESSKELIREKSNDDAKKVDEKRVSSRIKNKIKNMKKIHEEKEEKAEQTGSSAVTPEEEKANDDSKPKSTLEVQEKLKKSIKRYSRPNQPIEFTDSAFGFPLPPPSSSTLVMIDYRFPVHVERAIYRLSHLKLANPKRSLREQVILSNFMYAYLNLVDHTLHLEQQMTSDEFETAQPDGDLDFLGDQDIDTEFEADDGFEESDFDSIKIDLDVKDNQISV
ncbi:hypothetical protein OXX59_002825 [Metschnikowia pulcherrima]